MYTHISIQVSRQTRVTRTLRTRGVSSRLLMRDVRRENSLRSSADAAENDDDDNHGDGYEI